MDIKRWVKRAVMQVEKNSPYILTGFGAAGVVATAVMTGYSTLKAYEIICDNENKDWDPDEWVEHKKNPWKNRIKWTWKCYISPALMGSASIACIIGAQSVNSKRYAALAGLYSFTQDTLKDYREKVVEKIGEKKENQIHEEVVQERLNKNPKTDNTVIISGKGETLCYDSLSGRYFKHDIESIRQIVNDLNRDVINHMWVSLNDLYCALGIGTVKMGEDMGWNTDELLTIHFDTMLSNDGQPCLVLDYNVSTKYI